MSAQPTSAPAPERGLSASRAVRLVLVRELSTRVRSKAFLISNAVLLAVIVVGMVVTAVITGGGGDPTNIAVVGQAQSLSRNLTDSGKALGSEVEVKVVADERAARDQVSAGDVEVALLPGTDGGYTAVTDETVDSALRTVLDDAVQQQAVATALEGRGVGPAQLAADTAGAVLTVQALHPPKPDSDERTALAYVAVLLLYLQLLANGVTVATGVVEEKTSRVVELLLSTIKPLHLLTGKIMGIGLIGLAQLAAYGAAGLVTGLATGLLTVTQPALAVFAGTLGWFVLGFAFFATLYAAAASLVSRQEDVASTTAPLTVLVIGMFLVAQTSVQDPSGTISSVLSWVPPFSAILMPLRIAAGVTSPLQVVGTIALMAASTAVLAVLSAKVYERSVLQSGTRVAWRQAFGRD